MSNWSVKVPVPHIQMKKYYGTQKAVRKSSAASTILKTVLPVEKCQTAKARRGTSITSELIRFFSASANKRFVCV